MKRRPSPQPKKPAYRNPFAAGSDWVPLVQSPSEGDAPQAQPKISVPSKPPKVKRQISHNTHNESTPEVQTARFVLGATRLQDLPQDNLPQLAFFGRSNVGKSSLLLALMGRKGLVKISSSPGKTRELNFFLINDKFYFVDLPGIGYAKVSIAQRDIMAERIREYVEKSPHLKGIVYLVDMRVAGTNLDIETVDTLRDLGKPVLLVGSKRDKLNQGESTRALQQMQERFALEEAPLCLSAHTRQGLEDLWVQIHAALES